VEHDVDPACAGVPSAARSDASAFGPTLSSIAVSGAAGAGAGLVWGGIGGRLAMRLVFLTSSESVRGVTSDDGFEIGAITTATVGFVVAMTVLGGIAGLAFGPVRMLLRGPTGVVAAGVGTAVALGVGALVVHADGVDFVFLGPMWLTVGLFVLLPGLWGASVVVATDWLLAPGRLIDERVPRGRWRWPSLLAWLALGAIAVRGGFDLVGDVRELIGLR